MATKIERLERYDADGFAYGEGAWVTYSAARSQIDALLEALKGASAFYTKKQRAYAARVIREIEKTL